MDEPPLFLDGRPVRLIAAGEEGAPCVLFLHPYPLQGECWRPLMLACAASGFRAAALDAPGFGGSPALGRPLSMVLLAQLASSALDALGAARCALVGCSMGGYAALEFGRRFPHQLWASCLMNTKASPDSAEAKARREETATRALASGTTEMLEAQLPALVAPGFPVRSPEGYRAVQSLARGATAQGVADAQRGIGERRDLRPVLPLLNVPTLVIAGDSDQLIPREESEALAGGLGRGALLVVEEAGHYAFLEQPAMVEAALLGFLRQAGG